MLCGPVQGHSAPLRRQDAPRTLVEQVRMDLLGISLCDMEQEPAERPSSSKQDVLNDFHILAHIK